MFISKLIDQIRFGEKIHESILHLKERCVLRNTLFNFEHENATQKRMTDNLLSCLSSFLSETKPLTPRLVLIATRKPSCTDWRIYMQCLLMGVEYWPKVIHFNAIKRFGKINDNHKNWLIEFYWLPSQLTECKYLFIATTTRLLNRMELIAEKIMISCDPTVSGDFLSVA